MNQLTIDYSVSQKFFLITIIASFVVYLTSSKSFAQPINIQVQVNKKTIPAGGANYNFGYAVAVDSTTLMVGAPGVNDSTGVVFVYSKNTFGWHQTQVLTNPNSEPNEFFGNSIDICGYTAAIGAYGRSVVLIFQKIDGVWSYKETLGTSPGYQGFGTSIDLSENFLIVGFPTGVPAIGGSAFLYKKMEGMWIHRDIFYGEMYFGESVCYSSDIQPLFLIGDPTNRKVYAKIWDDAIISEFVLTPSDTTESDKFGGCIVSPNSSTIIIGDATHGRNSWIGCGAVYVFRKIGFNWVESQLIQPPILNYHLNFGSSISAYGDLLIIGAALENKLYIYKQVGNTYLFMTEITAEDSEIGDGFGTAVSCFEQNFVVGAPNDKIGANEKQGSVYIYSPCVLGSLNNIDFFASVIHSGSISLNTFLITDPGSIGSNYSLLSLIGWNINSQDGFTFQDGMVGANTDSLMLSKRNMLHPCWLKKSSNSTQWEYIGGRVEGNYVYSTVPFNSLSQFILVDSVDTATIISDNVLSYSNFQLLQNYPNPFNPSTKIIFTIPNTVILSGAKNLVTLKVFDVLGNEVTTLVDEFKPAGRYEVDFNSNIAQTAGLSSGVYFYQLKAGDFIQTRKMILLR